METAIQRANRIKAEYNLEDMEFKNSFHSVTKVEKIVESERAIVKYVTKPTLDRSKEIVISQGIDLTDFNKNPVILYVHNYGNSMFGGGSPVLPLGKDLWIKDDGNGLLAKQTYANHDLAEDVYRMHADGFPLASSIGFIPTKTIWRGSFNDKEWKKEIARLSDTYNIDKNNFSGAGYVYEKSLLLEHSDCPVGNNPDALALAIKSGKIAFKSEELNHVFESVFLHNQIGDLEVIVNQLRSDQKILEVTINTFTKDMVNSPDGKSKISQDYINSKVALAVDKYLNKITGRM